MLKHRIHSSLISFGKPCTVIDLFGVGGRKLLERLEVPEPWRGNITASVMLIDDLEVRSPTSTSAFGAAMPTTPTSRCS